MAKRTAIIDIGSNSISFVVYEKSSRYAFHLIEKLRSKVRIGEGAYDNNGHLSDIAMQRAFDTLEDYLSVTQSLGCSKVLAVATSALRDAPNKKIFLKRVSKELKLNIKIIDGQKEAYLGAVAALNLLPNLQDGTTIDIGGGSTELARIKDGHIVETISLNIGTVRLKELFVDKRSDFSNIESYIKDMLQVLPEIFHTSKIIGIGGTIRALSTAILKDTDYPLDSLHAFEYPYEEHRGFIKKVAQSEVLKLKKTSIARSRYDTIREGSAIFFLLCDRLGASEVITSKAGVREGVYLSDILRGCNHKFPYNFNVSVRSLIDRFAIYHKHIAYVQSTAMKSYEVLYPLFDKQQKYREELMMAAKLLLIARRLNIYSNSDMTFGFLVENLNFVLSHKQKILVALIVKYAHQKVINEKEIKQFQQLLPDEDVIKWLSFILSLTVCINQNKKIQKLEINYEVGQLRISCEKKMFLAKACIKKLKKPASFAIILESSS